MDDSLERTDSLLVHAPLHVGDECAEAAVDSRAQTGVATTTDAIEVQREHGAETDINNGSGGGRISLGSGGGGETNLDISAKLEDLQEQLRRLMGGIEASAERGLTAVSEATVPASVAMPAPLDRSVVRTPQPLQPAYEDEV